MADPVSLGITVALTVANMALTASRKIEGPRLDDLGYSGGDYGAPLLRIWGTRRIQPPVIFAEDLKEVKRRRKTKGGKFNDYTYFGTWAVVLARHQIDALRRLWFDGHPVYDVSGAGPVTPFDFGARGGSIDDYITVYLGTADQEPDPRILATTEARHGPGSCPAYRDTAYAVFKDVPLEKFGNRIPQVWGEVVVSGAPTYPSENREGMGGPLLAFSPDYTTLLASSGVAGSYSVVDVASRTVMLTGTSSLSTEDNASAHGYLSDGTLLMSRPTGPIISIPFGTSTATELDPLAYSLLGTITNVVDDNGNDYWLASSDPSYVLNGATYDSADDFGFSVAYHTIFRDMDGAIWIIGNKSGDLTTVAIHRVAGPAIGPENYTVEGVSGGNPVAFHYRDAEVDHFVVGSGGDLYTVDRETGDTTGSNTTVYAGGVGLDTFRAIAPGSRTFWIGFAEISSSDLSVVRQLDFRDWNPGAGGADAPTIYDPINHALITHGSTNIVFNALDRVGTSDVTLGEIVADVGELAGIAPSEMDTSDLVQTIPGYSVGAGTGKDWIEPLLDIYDSDGRPHGFSLQFLRRGAISGGSIAHGQFAQPRDDSPLYETPGAGGSDLPVMVTMQFADAAADQQPALANSGPLGQVDSQRITKLDMGTLALDSSIARQLVARWHRRRWFERQPYGLSLSMQQVALEPADVRTLGLPDGRTVTARLSSMVLGADRTIVTEWRADDPDVARLDGSPGAPYDGRLPSVISAPLLSKGFVLDIPLLSDADDAAVPQVYALAAPFADGPWPGAAVNQAIDGEYSEELASVPSNESAAWGYADAPLPYANPNLWDRGSELTVTLQVGELVGCTEAAANANPQLNLAAIGDNGRWEIVQFTVATLTAPLTYTLSGFKRGRKGTEWAAELHAAGDQFVLLDNANAVAMGLSEVGTDVSFKAITAGRTTGFPFGYEYEGQSLKPYAPVHLEAVKESNGDWTFAWVRRTRVGGAWTSGSTIPLGEATEEYEITVGDGVDSGTVTVTDPEYTWTLADQTTLTGGEVLAGDLEWTVAQVSAAVGAGFLATA